MAVTINGNGISGSSLTDGTVTSAKILDGTIIDGDVASVAASKLTGALPAISGAALTNLPGGGKVLGMAHTKYVGRQSSSGLISALTTSYLKQSATSKLIIQSFIWGESDSHNSTLRLWNSVDGYFSDGVGGQSDCSLKLDQGEYYSSDKNSTPGSGSHIAVTSAIAANTNVEFRWYVSSNTTLIGGSWSSSYEHAACWIIITEVEV